MFSLKRIDFFSLLFLDKTGMYDKHTKGICLIFYMTDETKNTTPVPDMTDMDEVRKAIIANEILTRKY